MYPTVGTLRDLLDGLPWPEFAFAPLAPSFLDDVQVLDFEVVGVGAPDSASLWIGFRGELSFSLPGLSGARLVLAGTPDSEGLTVLNVCIAWAPERSLTLVDVRVAWRFDESVLSPARGADGSPPAPYAEVAGTGSVRINERLEIELLDFGELALAPCEIAGTGLVISAAKVSLDLSPDSNSQAVTDLGYESSFVGVCVGEAELRFPTGFPAGVPSSVRLSKCVIGNGGVSGVASVDFADPTTHAYPEASLFGIRFRPRTLALELRQGSLIQASLSGEVQLPYFKPQWLSAEVGFDLDGALTVACELPAEALSVGDDFLKFAANRLAFSLQDGSLAVDLDGELQVHVEEISLPAFDLRGLRVAADGSVAIPGGWLDASEHKSVDLFGVQLEVDRVGFGTLPDGASWVGFSGGLRLVEGIRAGASVDGLRVRWNPRKPDEDPEVSLDGIGVEFSLPDALYFKGEIALDTAKKRFSGDLVLNLVDAGIAIDATLVIEKLENSDEMAFALYFALELPSAIPLGATGLGIFGFQGLFALNYEPNKTVQEPWYHEDNPKGYFQRGERGILPLTDPADPAGPGAKWSAAGGRLALGAGATIATVSDNGYVISGNFLLVLVLPGPVVLLQGAASLLTTRRSEKDGGEGDFAALAVLDGRSGQLVMGLDASYRQGPGGDVIDIKAGAEAFFDFGHPDRWYLNLGERDPRERRIRARLFKPLLEANAYLMLNADELSTGAWVGLVADWGWLRLEGWLDSEVLVRFRPVHVSGQAWLHASLAISVCGIGFGFAIDTRIRGEAVDPFEFSGDFSVRLDMPWPLDEVEVHVVLAWPREGEAPQAPPPLHEIGLEHRKTAVSWLPACDADHDLPVVPLDCQPVIAFQRPMNDAARVGTNALDIGKSWNWIGDRHVEYGLVEVDLAKRVGAQWIAVASRRTAGGGGDVEQAMYGQWDATWPPQTRLRLWARSPFEHLRRIEGLSWETWLSSRFPDYPCPPPFPTVGVCSGFDGYPLGSVPWPHLELPVAALSWVGADGRILPDLHPLPEASHELYLDAAAAQQGIRLSFGTEVSTCTIWLGQTDAEGGNGVNARLTATADSADGVVAATQSGRLLSFTANRIRSVWIRTNDSALALLRICTESEDRAAFESWIERFRSDMERWYDDEPILDPNSTYRLRVRTTIGGHSDVFFRTEGPPGRARLSLPGATDRERFDSGLRDLSLYVRGTSPPAALPTAGQPPAIYRPFYRAGDVAVEFNEEWVEAMYRRSQDALALVLYDASGVPARDSHGAAVDLSAWRRAKELALSSRELYWLHLVDQAACWGGVVDWSAIQHDQVIAIEGPDRALLAPETLFTARLELGRQPGVGEAPPLDGDAGGEPPCPTLPTLFQISFVTSRFASFFHHVFDGAGYLRRVEVSEAAWAAAVAAGDELACDALTATALGGCTARQLAPAFELTQVVVDGSQRGLLVRSPEPLPGDQVEVAVAVRDRPLAATGLSNGPLLLAGVNLGRSRGEDEWVDMLARQDVNPAGLTLQQWAITDRLAGTAEADALLRDSFASGALAGWQAIDEGTAGATAAWKPESGGVVEESGIRAANVAAGDRRATRLVAGDTTWTDIVVRVRVRPAAAGAVGVVFRSTDDGHYYRFSSDVELAVRRLEKNVGGVFSKLWQDDQPFLSGAVVEVTVFAEGDDLHVEADGLPVLSVRDGDLPVGGIGLYACGSPGAWFSSVEVHPAERARRVDARLHETFEGPLPVGWRVDGAHGPPSPAGWTSGGGELSVSAPALRWLKLGGDFDGAVLALATGDDGRITAGGEFLSVDGAEARYVASWDGNRWAPMGGGLDGTVHALAIAGHQQFVAGAFTTAGGNAIAGVAVWNRILEAWNDLGAKAEITGRVNALLLDGSALWIGGDFTWREVGSFTVGGRHLAVWATTSGGWSSTSPLPNGPVRAFGRLPSGLAIAGEFTAIAVFDFTSIPPARVSRQAPGLAQLGATKDPAIPGGMPDAPVAALAAAANQLFAAGEFARMGGLPAQHVARFSDAAWSSLGGGVDQRVAAMTLGENWLYLAGTFSSAGGRPAPGVARWNTLSEHWEPLPAPPGVSPRAIATTSLRTLVAGGPPGWVAELLPAGPQWIVAGDSAWTDVRVNVRLVPSRRGFVGLAVGWNGPDDCVVWWIDVAEKTSQLVRRSGGVEVLLWNGATQDLGATRLWQTLEASADRLRGAINGHVAFDVSAPAPCRGAIALMVRDVHDLRFEEVEVLAPSWVPWFSFGNESVFAGTHLRLRSGPALSSILRGPGHLDHTAVAGGLNGRVRFPVGGARLRLLDRDGAIVQEKVALSESSYRSVDVQVRKRADGTALLITPSGPGEFLSGKMRLTLRYRRKALGGRLPFAVAGNQDDEIAQLDL